MTIAIIGLGLAKSVFQAHDIDAGGKVVLTKGLHRKQMLPFFSELPPGIASVSGSAADGVGQEPVEALDHAVGLG